MRNTRPVETGEEQDAFTGWRSVLCYMQRAGTVKAVKRRYHRKERRWGKRDIEVQRREEGQ